MSEQETDTSASILLLHGSSVDPYPFLARLTDTPESEDPLRDSVPWTIDNKYYTADVVFRPHLLNEPTAAHPVIIYLFSGQPSNPLPASLTRLSVLDPPPDIALAIRIKSNDNYGPLGDDVDERFDEIGMEVVDELGDADDDDERPLDPLEMVRQTLMTHMWPNMKRKAAPQRDIPRPDLAVDAEEESGDESAAQFPVSFSRAVNPTLGTPGPASDFPTPEAEAPSPPAGYSRVPADADEFGEFASGPSASEYARLDAWLDDDGQDEAEEGGDADKDEEARRHIPPAAANGNGNGHGFYQFVDEDELPGFDDDFGPMPGMRGDEPVLPLDPTPLLLHLQQVRADLSTLEDEDERRRRAAEEVTRVMASLGFGGADWDDPLEGVDGLDGIEGLGGSRGQEDGIARLDRLDRLDAL